MPISDWLWQTSTENPTIPTVPVTLLLPAQRLQIILSVQSSNNVSPAHPTTWQSTCTKSRSISFLASPYALTDYPPTHKQAYGVRSCQPPGASCWPLVPVVSEQPGLRSIFPMNRKLLLYWEFRTRR